MTRRSDRSAGSTSEGSSSGGSTRTGRLFRRATRLQQAVVVLCVLVGVHGLWVVFVPGVQLDDSDLPCPPAVIAAFAGSAGVEITDGSADLAESHDAACAATGRRWLVGGLLQIGIATVWGLATLEWARVWRRSRRQARREARRETRRETRQGASDSSRAS